MCTRNSFSPDASSRWLGALSHSPAAATDSEAPPPSADVTDSASRCWYATLTAGGVAAGHAGATVTATSLAARDCAASRQYTPRSAASPAPAPWNGTVTRSGGGMRTAAWVAGGGAGAAGADAGSAPPPLPLLGADAPVVVANG